jgi:hypothetical protein
LGGDVGNGADSGVVEPALEADGAQRSKSVGNADAETNVVAPLTLLLGQRSDCVTHFERHEYGLERRVLYWNRIIEDHHHAIASVPFERAAVLDHYLANCRMIIAQQSHHVFWVGTL